MSLDDWVSFKRVNPSTAYGRTAFLGIGPACAACGLKATAHRGVRRWCP